MNPPGPTRNPTVASKVKASALALGSIWFSFSTINTLPWDSERNTSGTINNQGLLIVEGRKERGREGGGGMEEGQGQL